MFLLMGGFLHMVLHEVRALTFSPRHPCFSLRSLRTIPLRLTHNTHGPHDGAYKYTAGLNPNVKISSDQVRRVFTRAESGSGPTLRITSLTLQEPRPLKWERRGIGLAGTQVVRGGWEVGIVDRFVIPVVEGDY